MSRLLLIPTSSVASERIAFYNQAIKLHKRNELPGVEYAKRIAIATGLKEEKIEDAIREDIVVVDGSNPELVRDLPDSENVFVIFPSFKNPTARTIQTAKRYLRRHKIN